MIEKKRVPTVDPSLPECESPLPSRHTLTVPAAAPPAVDVPENALSPNCKQPADLMACLTRMTLADLNELKSLQASTTDEDKQRYDKIRKRVRLFLSSQRDRVYGEHLEQDLAPKVHTFRYQSHWHELVFQTANQLLALTLDGKVNIDVAHEVDNTIEMVSVGYRTAMEGHTRLNQKLSQQDLDQLKSAMEAYLKKMAQQYGLVSQLRALIKEHHALEHFKQEAEQNTFEIKDQFNEVAMPIEDLNATRVEAATILANKTPRQGERLSTPVRQELVKEVLNLRAVDESHRTMLDIAIELDDVELIEDVLLYADHIDTVQVRFDDHIGEQTRLIARSLNEPIFKEQRVLFDEAEPADNTNGVMISERAKAAIIRYANDEALELLLKKLSKDYPHGINLPDVIQQAVEHRRDNTLDIVAKFNEATQHFADILKRHVTQYDTPDADKRKHYWNKLQLELNVMQTVVLNGAKITSTVQEIHQRLLNAHLVTVRRTPAGCFSRRSWTEKALNKMRLPTSMTPCRVSPMLGDVYQQVEHSLQQKQGMERRYLLTEQVFKEVLKYLNKNNSWYEGKKKALLEVIENFSIGKINSYEDFKSVLKNKEAQVYKTLNLRKDGKTTIAARSYGKVIAALDKYQHLLLDIQKLPRPSLNNLVAAQAV